MGAILPWHAADIDQAEKRLIDQRRRLQRVIATLATHVAGGDAAKLGIHERRELLQRGGVAVAPGLEQPCHLTGRRLSHPTPRALPVSSRDSALFQRRRL